ncbi:MAG: hypothetical protein ACLFUU_04470 [Desulfobacteraceae bacterium]
MARSRYGQLKREKEIARKQKYQEKLKRRQNKSKPEPAEFREDESSPAEEGS